jgi:Kef-type K+ transport system membrane component KefB/mannitol/fructose-specific phosphotransferase system IIA component (Ntr-type)
MTLKSKILALFAILFSTVAITLATEVATSTAATTVVESTVIEEVQAQPQAAVIEAAEDGSQNVAEEASTHEEEEHKPDMTHMMTVLAIQVGIILFAARIGGIIAEKMNLPSVLGELGAGIVIGPYALGGVITTPNFFPHGLFPEIIGSTMPVSAELYGLCTIASIILLFLAGVETDLKMFMRYSLAGSLVGIGGVVGSFILGDVCAMLLLPKLLPTAFPNALSFMDAPCLLLGIMSTATSVGITARILAERKCIDSEEGVTIMAGAVIDDVLGIIVLAIGLGVIEANSGASGSTNVNWGSIGIIAAKAFGVWIGATIVGIILARKISTVLKLFENPISIATMALGLSLILAGLFETAGLAMIIGAYVMGLAMSRTDIRYVIHENLAPVYTFLVPIFFCVMGMMVDVSALMDKSVLIFGLIYTVLAVIAKIAGCALPSLLCGFNLRGATRIGAGMIPRGEVALIIAGIGLSKGYLTSDIFSIGIIMTLITTVLAPPLLVELFKSPKSGLRNPKDPSEASRPLEFTLPTEEAAALMCSKLLDSFRKEGFFTHVLSEKDHIWQVRRDTMEIGIHKVGNIINFECTPTEQSFIATAILDVTVDLGILSNALRKPITTDNITKMVNDSETPDPVDNSITKYINSFILCPSVESDDKTNIIRKLCHILFEKGLISDFEATIKAVLSREDVISTGLENGIAVPHARVNTVKDLVGIVAIIKDGITDYSTIDNSKVKIVILTLSPEDANTPHLRMISHIGKVLDANGCEKLLSSKTEQDMRDALLG